MTDQAGIDWPTCGQDGCIGVRLAAIPKCLAHTLDKQRNATLKQLGETGEIDARGVSITPALLQQILAAAPHDADNHPTFTVSRFDNATFQGGAGFNDATFQGGAYFDDATFQGGAKFVGATFQDDARFWGAAFQGGTWFDGATFQGEAGFVRAVFQGDARFVGTMFQDGARFYKATFQGAAMFVGAIFQGGAWFVGVTYERARQIGPLLAHRLLQLDDAQFMQPVQIEASTIGVSCRRTRFAGGVQFRLRWAHVLLDDADLAAPSIVVGIPRLTGGTLAMPEQRIAQEWQKRLDRAVPEQPGLLSVRRANVAGLGLANVDLADCRFAGAHNLDKLRLEADVNFAVAPVRLRWDWRQLIAEERAWRVHRSGRAHGSGRWSDPVWPAWAGDEPTALEASQIAGLYRALRKGREDAKDEPGAADFYYGEMEMRRHAGSDVSNRPRTPSRGRVERGILTVYWLVSGYGLRAWRALAWLAAVTAVFAVGFHLAGFTRPPQPVSYWTSLLYSFRATLSLTDSEVELTAWGKLLQALLRLTGPVLLGLALLAIRARTKR